MTTIIVEQAYNTTVVTEQSGEVTVVASPTTTDNIAVVEVGLQGPTGPSGSAGIRQLYNLEDVDITGVQDKNVLRYDAATSKWIDDTADNIITLTDGGNF